MYTNNYFAAIDIGGSKTIAAIADEAGNILDREKFVTYSSSAEENLKICGDKLQNIIDRNGICVKAIKGIGISVPGITDGQREILLYAPFADWNNVHVCRYFRERFGVSNVKCENDVNACAIGELKLGLGKKYTDFLWLTVSNGIGGAIVSESKLIRGTHGFAGEAGHIKVEYENPVRCPCGDYGCMEAQCSGGALVRIAKEKGLIPDGAECARLARDGNETALGVFNEVGFYLGRGIAVCINLLDPQAVIVGGGVSMSLDLLLPGIRDSLNKYAFKKIRNVDIVQTALGYDASLMGALSLVI